MESQGSLWSMTSVHSWWRSQSSTCLSGSFLSGFVASWAGFSPLQVDGPSLENTRTVFGYSVITCQKERNNTWFYHMTLFTGLVKRAYAPFQTVRRTYWIMCFFSRHDPWCGRLFSWGHLLPFSNGSLQTTEGKVAAPWSCFSVVLASIMAAFSCPPFPGSSWEWASQQWQAERQCWRGKLQSGCGTPSWPNPVGPSGIVTTCLHLLIWPDLSLLWPKKSLNWHLLLSVQVASPPL